MLCCQRAYSPATGRQCLSATYCLPQLQNWLIARTGAGDSCKGNPHNCNAGSHPERGKRQRDVPGHPTLLERSSGAVAHRRARAVLQDSGDWAGGGNRVCEGGWRVRGLITRAGRRTWSSVYRVSIQTGSNRVTTAEAQSTGQSPSNTLSPGLERGSRSQGQEPGDPEQTGIQRLARADPSPSWDKWRGGAPSTRPGPLVPGLGRVR